jgi:hypothetical protein
MKRLLTAFAVVVSLLCGTPPPAPPSDPPSDPPSAPPPPAPAPSPASCARAVKVATVAALVSAVGAALPGDCILLAPGTYTLAASLTIARSGTATAPIVIEGGGSNTIIDVNKKYLFLDGSHVRIRKIRATNFPTIGFWIRGATDDVLDSMEIDHSGQEAVKLMNGSHHNTITRSLIHDTGIVTAQYGEGIYIGGKTSTDGFDSATYNAVTFNHFGPNVRAEDVDVKEGADHTTIYGNYFDATGMVFINYATVSVVAIVGSYATIDSNYFHLGNPEGVSFIHGKETMAGNVGMRNTMDLQPNRAGMPWASVYAPSAIAGFQFQQASLKGGAVVKCDNVMVSGRLSTLNTCSPL